MTTSMPPAGDPLVVQTVAGAVRGAQTDHAVSWKGMRYAEPPVGALRWRAPVAVSPWEGVAPALEFAGVENRARREGRRQYQLLSCMAM